MTSFRREGPTIGGGMYEVVTYIKLDTLEEVDQAEATGMAIAEYDGDGTMLFETIGTYNPLAAQQL